MEMEQEPCFLACSPWLAQPLLYNPGSPRNSASHSGLGPFHRHGHRPVGSGDSSVEVPSSQVMIDRLIVHAGESMGTAILCYLRVEVRE